MKTILLFLFGITIASESFAQHPLVKQWDKRFGSDNNTHPGTVGSELRDLLQTNDGGFLMAGHSGNRAGGDMSSDGCDTVNPFNIWVIKTDPLGNIQWNKTIGGGSAAVAAGIVPAPNGGYYIGGVGGDTGCYQSSTMDGYEDYWLLKIDSLGNKIWDRSFGGSDFDECRKICATSDGGCIMAGWSTSPASGDKTEDNWYMSGTPDWWIIKVDSSGNLLWDQTIGTEFGETDINVSPTLDGGCYLSGRPGGEYSGDFWYPLMSNGVWVLKLNSSGNIVMNLKLDADNSDINIAINTTADGGCILLNSSLSGAGFNKTEANHIAGDDDLWLIKLSGNGVKQWDKVIGGFGLDFWSLCQYIEQTADGGYLFATGSTSEGFDKTQSFWAQNTPLDTVHPWILKTDSLGNVQWDKVVQVGNFSGYGVFGGADVFFRAIECNDGSIAFANSNFAGAIGEKTDTAWKFGHSDYWMIKYAAQPCNARFNLFPDTTQQHHYYIINQSYGDQPIQYTWDWGDGSYDTIPYPSHTYANAGIYTICLSIQDAGACASTYCDSMQSILGPGNVPVVVDVIPQQITTVENTAVAKQSIVVFPNPSNDKIEIHSKDAAINLVTVYNFIGENVSVSAVVRNKNLTVADVSTLKAGIYFVRVQTDQGISVQKIEVR